MPEFALSYIFSEDIFAIADDIDDTPLTYFRRERRHMPLSLRFSGHAAFALLIVTAAAAPLMATTLLLSGRRH